MENRAVCLNCMDGRTQLPVIHWIKDNYDVDYVDMVTEAGMDGLLADQSRLIEDIVRKIKISIEKNNASMIFVVGHHDCKGNAVDDAIHKEHIHRSIQRVQKEFPEINIVGIWVNKKWMCEVVL